MKELKLAGGLFFTDPITIGFPSEQLCQKTINVAGFMKCGRKGFSVMLSVEKIDTMISGRDAADITIRHLKEIFILTGEMSDPIPERRI